MALSETLYGKTPEQLAAVCAELGMPRFAAKQLARWLYAKHVEDPMRMSDIAAAHRAPHTSSRGNAACAGSVRFP